jgi:hypothetical protein
MYNGFCAYETNTRIVGLFGFLDDQADILTTSGFRRDNFHFRVCVVGLETGALVWMWVVTQLPLKLK